VKITYLSTARIPDDWAHVLQIMKMCAAFAKAGHAVELLVPHRARTRHEDPYVHANVKPVFTITRLPCIDLFPGTQSGILYWLRMFSFFFFARLYLLFVQHDLVYTRELAFASLRDAVFEVHTVTLRMHAFRARHIVAITEGIKKDLVQKGFVAESIVVAPDAVDLDEFVHPESKEVARARLGISLDAKVALYVGMLGASWKGIETLCEAAKLLAPDVAVVVIGGEPFELERLRPRYPKVLFLGFHPYRELPDNLAVADALVLPNSAKEVISAKYTSPLKLFAYMAAGKPIVASDLPSLREVLNESNAFLVAPDDSQALAEGIRYALEHPGEAAARAKRARNDVTAYTWEKRAARILKKVV
jgi:glycosyltransferase involved in cell wall biosynthesis